MPERQAVQLSYSHGLAELVLCAPDTSNAVDLEMACQLRDAAVELASAAGLRAVLIRAEGKNFCVGGDLRAFAAQAGDLSGYVQSVAGAAHVALEYLTGLPVPVVSAVQGAVAGAGVGLAFSADVVLIASSARIRLAYTAIGLSPDNGSTWLLPRLLGPRLATELALTNRTVTAAEAVNWGLAGEMVEDAGLAAAARATARRLADGPAAALVATKRLLRESSPSASLHDQLAREADSISQLARTPGAIRAIRAFVER